jgi:hypothetical protein
MSGPPPGSTERRRAERVRIPETNPPVRVVGARVIDASPYGMRIESPVAMEADSVLSFRIVVGGRAVDVACRVALCRSGADARRFEIGLEFLDLSAADRDRLRDALQRA